MVLRCNAFWRCLECWAVGLSPSPCRVIEGAFKGMLTWTKTTGADKNIQSRVLHVHRNWWLVHPNWVPVGWKLWEESAPWERREHSPRAFLTSCTGFLRYPTTWQDAIGGWSPRQSQAYVRATRRRISEMQTGVAKMLRKGRGDLGEHMPKIGCSEELVKRTSWTVEKGTRLCDIIERRSGARWKGRGRAGKGASWKKESSRKRRIVGSEWRRNGGLAGVREGRGEGRVLPPPRPGRGVLTTVELHPRIRTSPFVVFHMHLVPLPLGPRSAIGRVRRVPHQRRNGHDSHL